MKNLILAVITILGSCGFGAAQTIVPSQPGAGNSYNGYLINSPGITSNQIYTLDLSKYNTSKVSAQVYAGTATFKTFTFQDGTQSTGSVTIGYQSQAGISSAAATDSITIISTTGLLGAKLTIASSNAALPNTYVIQEGQSWWGHGTSTNTAEAAVNLAAAIQKAVPWLKAGPSGTVVTATATYGALYNSVTFASNNTSMTVSGANMSGGLDPLTLTVNGVKFVAGTSFYVGASSYTTMSNLATAINNTSTGLGLTIVAGAETSSAGLGITTMTSILNGAGLNYAITSSSPTAMSVANSGLYGGQSNITYNYNSAVFADSSTLGWVNGIMVKLTTVAASGTQGGLGGLTSYTTYYASLTGNSAFVLTTCSTCAVAGGANALANAIVINSTSTQLGSSGSNSYTIAPVAPSVTAWAPSYVWQDSNDNVNWANVSSTGTVTVSSTTQPAPLQVDFGVFNYRYLRLNVTSPTAQQSGPMLLTVPVFIKQDGIGQW